jgi:hypothetical protein
MGLSPGTLPSNPLAIYAPVSEYTNGKPLKKAGKSIAALASKIMLICLTPCMGKAIN